MSQRTASPAEPRPQSAAAPSPFPPIADYAFLSDCHTGALVAPDGAIDWLCIPSFDAPSVFGSLLDREAGAFRLAPFGINVPATRAYEPGTNTLVTTWQTPRGWVEVRDALTLGPRRREDTVTPHTRPPADDDADHGLVRTVLCLEGGIDGRRDLTESTRDELSGYAGARPVRIGNGAFDQRQNDVYGSVLDSILLHTRRSSRLPRRLWPIVQSQAECARRAWREPDQGIWEARGDPSTTSPPSSCAGWPSTGPPSWPTSAATPTWARRGAPPPTRSAFLRGDDERLRAGILAVADELTEDGFVLRYVTDETDDGLAGKEGTFLICSFWLVSALAIIGEEQRARDLMERLLSVASPLGLYAEEFDAATGRHLGNFPQAFSHLALIEAAARIILAERLEEYTS